MSGVWHLRSSQHHLAKSSTVPVLSFLFIKNSCIFSPIGPVRLGNFQHSLGWRAAAIETFLIVVVLPVPSAPSNAINSPMPKTKLNCGDETKPRPFYTPRKSRRHNPLISHPLRILPQPFRLPSPFIKSAKNLLFIISECLRLTLSWMVVEPGTIKVAGIIIESEASLRDNTTRPFFVEIFELMAFATPTLTWGTFIV